MRTGNFKGGIGNLEAEQEILEATPKISKVENHFLNKVKKFFERKDLMHSIP